MNKFIIKKGKIIVIIVSNLSNLTMQKNYCLILIETLATLNEFVYQLEELHLSLKRDTLHTITDDTNIVHTFIEN